MLTSKKTNTTHDETYNEKVLEDSYLISYRVDHTVVDTRITL